MRWVTACLRSIPATVYSPSCQTVLAFMPSISACPPKGLLFGFHRSCALTRPLSLTERGIPHRLRRVPRRAGVELGGGKERDPLVFAGLVARVFPIVDQEYAAIDVKICPLDPVHLVTVLSTNRRNRELRVPATIDTQQYQSFTPRITQGFF